MNSAVQGRFANLGMAKKLGIGFALVLLLTAVVAAIGVASLQTISQRFDGLNTNVVAQQRSAQGAPA